jgi:hypothetical protein
MTDKHCFFAGGVSLRTTLFAVFGITIMKEASLAWQAAVPSPEQQPELLLPKKFSIL